MPASGDVDVLLLPTLTLVRARRDRRPAHGVGARRPSGASSGARRGAAPATRRPPSYVAQLDTGRSHRSARSDLLTPRTGASVTAFGPGALVAGGVGSDGTRARHAEVYRHGAAAGFDQQNLIR